MVCQSRINCRVDSRLCDAVFNAKDGKSGKEKDKVDKEAKAPKDTRDVKAVVVLLFALYFDYPFSWSCKMLPWKCGKCCRES